MELRQFLCVILSFFHSFPKMRGLLPKHWGQNQEFLFSAPQEGRKSALPLLAQHPLIPLKYDILIIVTDYKSPLPFDI